MRSIITLIAVIACVIGVAQYRRHRAREREAARIAAERDGQRRLDSLAQVEHERALAAVRDDSARAARQNAIRDAHLTTPTGITQGRSGPGTIRSGPVIRVPARSNRPPL
jgi:hypothetical protein